jgi:hypothetical protein
MKKIRHGKNGKEERFEKWGEVLMETKTQGSPKEDENKINTSIQARN